MGTSKLLSIGLIVLVATLFVAGVALATDFVWDGGSMIDNGWTRPNNWDLDSGYPDDGNDNASIEDVTPESTCTFDSQSAITINDLAVAGDSPTKMILHVKDAALTVDGVATFGDYAAVDADQDLTIDDTDMSGNIWIDVADGKTVDLGTTVDIVGSAAVSGISCNLRVQDNASGTFQGATVTVDADTPDLDRGLRFSSSGSTFDVTTKLVLKSDQTAGTKRAKLWILAGTMNIDDGAAGTNAVLEIDGGDDATRRVDIDIDDILIAEETQFKSGYVGMDVASGKTVKGGDVVFEAGAIVKKTGAGTFRSGA